MKYNDKLDPINNINFPGTNLITFQLVHRIINYQINKNDYKPKYFFFFTIIKGVGNQNNRTYDFKQKINIKYNTRELAMLSFVFKQLAVGNVYVLPYDKFSRNKKVNLWQPVSKSTNTKYAKPVSYNLVVSDKTFNNNVKYSMALTIHEMYALSIELDLLINKAFTLDFKEQVLAEIQKDTSIPLNQNNNPNNQNNNPNNQNHNYQNNNQNNIPIPIPNYQSQQNYTQQNPTQQNIIHKQPSQIDSYTSSGQQHNGIINNIKNDFNNELAQMKGI
jgi:murein DD-endopeptidase MepM/ murein hydrolase activator NlpD